MLPVSLPSFKRISRFDVFYPGKVVVLALICLPLFDGITASADDWPQYQGKDRDNRSAESGLLTTWPDAGPALAWTFDTAGTGYSAPAIADGRAFFMGGRDGKTELICLEESSGQELWSIALNEKIFDFEGNSWGAGPRSTPTVDGDRVYALTGDGNLACVSTEGKLLWTMDLVSQLGGSIKSVDAGEPETYGWGFCWAPIVDGENLICTPGSADGSGLVVALDK
ncbi:MAG: PQQ-binding-like beta-propeller repeat protein, partial [Planctomycetota bacterium]